MTNKFTVTRLAATENPQALAYRAMHQDYSSTFIGEELHDVADVTEGIAGEIVVKRLLKGDRGHYGPLEHPQISFACGYFPHTAMQQARTHRVGISFDVQSTRYTKHHIIQAADNFSLMEDVFYFRPVGHYTDRQGDKYYYSKEERFDDIGICYGLAKLYKKRVCDGHSEEHARLLIPYNIRQHFVVSFNARSLMHFLDLRHKLDAELEIQLLADMLFTEFALWMPQVAKWYEDKRLNKARLSP